MYILKCRKRGMQYAMCINSKYLEIEIISEDIKNTSENKFQNILNEAIKRKAFEYLCKKRGTEIFRNKDG